MAKWIMKDPVPGDIIRVEIGKDLHHYGIYASDDEVIQYGKRTDVFHTDAKDVSVLVTTIQEFLGGKFLEVRELTLMERLRKKDGISNARSRIGEMKYDIFENNCEHFVNDCVFGRHESVEAKQYKKN